MACSSSAKVSVGDPVSINNQGAVVFGGCNNQINANQGAIVIGSANTVSGNYYSTIGTYGSFAQGYGGAWLNPANMTLEEMEEHFEFCENNHTDHITFKNQYEVVEDINKKLIEMPFGGFVED